MRLLRALLLLLLVTGASAYAEGWAPVAPGIEYLHLERDGIDVHLVVVNLDVPSLEVVATAAARGCPASPCASSRS